MYAWVRVRERVPASRQIHCHMHACKKQHIQKLLVCRKDISAYVTVFVCVCGIAASSRVPKLQYFVTGSASGIDI